MKFTSYHLKILALVTMTIDHFGVIVIDPILTSFDGHLYTFFLILRIIGRLAFPLFAFMLVEAIFHTRNIVRYLGQLAGMALLIGGAIYILNLQGFSISAGNIFIDLFFSALFLAFLHSKRWYLMILSVLPALFVIFSDQLNFPNAYAADYGIYGLVMIFFFYIAKQIYASFNHEKNNIFKRIFVILTPLLMHPFYISSAGLFMVNMIWYILYVVSGNSSLAFIGIQSYSIFAGLIIVRYSGTLGQPPRWFKAFSYLYYPLHFIVLFGLYSILVAII
jgi:hypothetical protein